MSFSEVIFFGFDLLSDETSHAQFFALSICSLRKTNSPSRYATTISPLPIPDSIMVSPSTRAKKVVSRWRTSTRFRSIVPFM